MVTNTIHVERMKTCTYCGEEKPLSAFSKHRLSKDGHAYQCKKCNAKRAKVWRSTPSGIYTALKGQINYTKKHMNRRDYRGYIRRPRKDLLCSREEFIGWYNIQPKKCAYCGISEEKLDSVNDVWNEKLARLSVDCVDNDRGYSLDNMVLACGRCNITKNDFFTFEEMKVIGKIIGTHWESNKGENDE